MLKYLDVVAALEAKGWDVRKVDAEEVIGGPEAPEDELDPEFVDAPDSDEIYNYDGEDETYEIIVDGKRIYLEFVGVQPDGSVFEAAMFSYENNNTSVYPWFTETLPDTVDEYVIMAETFFDGDGEE